MKMSIRLVWIEWICRQSKDYWTKLVQNDFNQIQQKNMIEKKKWTKYLNHQKKDTSEQFSSNAREVINNLLNIDSIWFMGENNHLFCSFKVVDKSWNKYKNKVKQSVVWCMQKKVLVINYEKSFD